MVNVMNVTEMYQIKRVSIFKRGSNCPVLSALCADLGSVTGVHGSGGLYKISFVCEIPCLQHLWIFTL